MVQEPKKIRSGNPGPLFLDFSNLFVIVQKESTFTIPLFFVIAPFQKNQKGGKTKNKGGKTKIKN